MAERAFQPYRRIVSLSASAAACNVRFSPDGRLLAVGCNRSIVIYSFNPGTPISCDELKLPGDIVIDISFSPDSRFLAISFFSSAIQIRYIATGVLVRTLAGHARPVYCVMYSPQPVMIASGSSDDTIRIWDGDSGACLRVIPARMGGVSTLDFCPDGSKIVAGSIRAGCCRVWDPATGNLLITIKEQGMPRVGSVKFSSDGNFILIGLVNSSLRIWCMVHGLLPIIYGTHLNRDLVIFSTFVRADGNYFVSGSEDNGLYIWEVMPGRLVQRIDDAHMEPVVSVITHPTQNVIASLSSSQYMSTVKLWTQNP